MIIFADIKSMILKENIQKALGYLSSKSLSLIAKGRDTIERYASGGHPEAQYYQAKNIQCLYDRKYKLEALDLFSKSMNAGFELAELGYGKLLLELEQDKEKGVEIIKKFANKNNVEALYYLGFSL